METELYSPIPQRIIDELRKAETVAVIGHENPDGDCIFSSLALALLLRMLGKRVELFNQGPFNRDEINSLSSLFSNRVDDDFLALNPLVCVVDCSTADRPGEIFKPFSSCTKIVFDHHSSGESFTDDDLMYIKSASVSTTMIIDHLRRTLGLPLTPQLADCIYRGFATDTGFFHFLNEKVGGETLRRVADLVDQGVSPYSVFDEMHDGKKLDYFRFVSMLVQRTESVLSGQILYTWQKKDEKVSGKPADDIYSQLLQVEGVRIVFFFKEKEDHVEIGMRSKQKCGIDIGAFASTLGGGGHRFAAGAREEGSLESVIQTVLSRASQLDGIDR